jgi:hypothetical protein
MLTEGLAIVRAIHERYHPLKRNPFNEVECGDHYARALASWGVLAALAGYEYHGPKGHLAFGPRITPEDFRAAFTTAEGWGTFAQKRERGAQQNRIDVRWGKLRVRTVAFGVAAGHRPVRVSAAAAGPPRDVTYTLRDGRVHLDLQGELTLTAGEALRITIQ